MTYILDANDWKRKILETWIGVKNKRNVYDPFYVTSVGESNNGEHTLAKGIMSIQGQKPLAFNTIFLDSVSEDTRQTHEILTHMPELGMVSPINGSWPLYVMGISAYKWKTGYTPDRVSVFDPFRRFRSFSVEYSKNLNFIRSLMNNSYLDYNTALKWIEEGHIRGCALSYNYGIGSAENNTYICREGYIIGMVNRNTKSIVINKKLAFLLEELSELTPKIEVI